MHDLIERQAAIDAILAVTGNSSVRELYEHVQEHGLSDMWSGGVNAAIDIIIAVPSAQPDTEKICARIKAEAIKRNVEYMKHGDRYMLGFVDGMRLARRIVDGTIDDPVYFTLSGE